MCPSVGTRGLSVPQCVGTTGGGGRLSVPSVGTRGLSVPQCGDYGRGGKVECTKCGD